MCVFRTWSDSDNITLKFTVLDDESSGLDYSNIELNYILSDHQLTLSDLTDSDLIYKSVDTYYAYFDSRGGEEVESFMLLKDYKIFPHDVISTNVEKYYILPSITRSGYKFLGWTFSESPDDYLSSLSFSSLETGITDYYFYANWEPLFLNGNYTCNDYFTINRDGYESVKSFDAKIVFSSNNKVFSNMKFVVDDSGCYLFYDNIKVAYSNSDTSGNIFWFAKSYSNITFDNVFFDNESFLLFLDYNFVSGTKEFVNFSGYYYFNETVDYTNTLSFYSSFISNGNIYSKIYVDNGAIRYDNTLVYDSVYGWVDENYRLVNFSDTSVSLENYSLILKYGIFDYISFNSTDNNITDLLFSFADIPVRIMSQLLDISIFGTTFFVVFCGILTFLIVIVVIRKFW